MKIGLPKERSKDERRMAVTPGGLSDLKANGHDIYVEAGAGEDARFSDQEYSDAGAEIVWSTDELYKKSEIILKVAPPDDSEHELLQPDQTVISALHLGNTTEGYLKELIRKNITGIGFRVHKIAGQQLSRSCA
jgi:alanine dehydrogenase